MKLKDISEQIEFKKLKLSNSGIFEALLDIANKQLSRTVRPLEILKSKQLVDGYHRVVQAMLNGQTSLPYTIIAESGSYPIVGGWFKVKPTILQGLEVFINDMDEDQLYGLVNMPIADENIEHYIMDLIQQQQ